jgi:hypothetical protein
LGVKRSIEKASGGVSIMEFILGGYCGLYCGACPASGDSIILRNLEQHTSSNNTEDIVGSVEFSAQFI